MKINKIILKISHLFGYRLGEEHQDDITINIPLNYPEKDINTFLFGDSSCVSVRYIFDEIFKKIHKRFELDKVFEKRCRNIKQVWVTYYKDEIDIPWIKFLERRKRKRGGSIMNQFPYVDGVLYNPYNKDDIKALDRSRKLESILKS